MIFWLSDFILKVADYEENFMQYRGQMEGEALRAITNGYRNALSAIPSSRRSKCSSIDPLFPLTRLSAYSENGGCILSVNSRFGMELGSLTMEGTDLPPNVSAVLNFSCTYQGAEKNVVHSCYESVWDQERAGRSLLTPVELWNRITSLRCGRVHVDINLDF